MWVCSNVECMEANENERDECKKCKTKKERQRLSANTKKRQSMWERAPRTETDDVPQGNYKDKEGNVTSHQPDNRKSQTELQVHKDDNQAQVQIHEIIPRNTSPTIDNDEIDDILSSSEPEVTEYQELRVVMVGKTGSGKSATGNSLLGKKHFKSKLTGKSVTMECCLGETEYDGKRVVVIDTPGLFDTQLEPEQIRGNIISCIGMSFPGPHVFLIVLQIGRFTEEEIDAINQLFEIFGMWMANFSIVIFTGMDGLELEGGTIETYIEETGESIQKYIKRCGGRYFALNNIASDDKKENMRVGLITKIEEMVKQNNGNFFSNEITTNFKENIDETVKNDKAPYDTIKRVKHELEAKKKLIKDEKEAVKQKIDFQTELKEKVTRRRVQADDFDTDLGDETIKASEQGNTGTTNIELTETEQEIIENLNLLKTKHNDLENQYEEIKKNILQVKHEGKKRISAKIKKSTAEACRFLKTVEEIDDQLDKIQNKLENIQENDKYRKVLTDQQEKLSKQRFQILSKQSKSLEKVIQNSHALEENLRRKKKLCRVM